MYCRPSIEPGHTGSGLGPFQLYKNPCIDKCLKKILAWSFSSLLCTSYLQTRASEWIRRIWQKKVKVAKNCEWEIIWSMEEQLIEFSGYRFLSVLSNLKASNFFPRPHHRFFSSTWSKDEALFSLALKSGIKNGHPILTKAYRKRLGTPKKVNKCRLQQRCFDDVTALPPFSD